DDADAELRAGIEIDAFDEVRAAANRGTVGAEGGHDLGGQVLAALAVGQDAVVKGQVRRSGGEHWDVVAVGQVVDLAAVGRSAGGTEDDGAAAGDRDVGVQGGVGQGDGAVRVEEGAAEAGSADAR